MTLITTAEIKRKFPRLKNKDGYYTGTTVIVLNDNEDNEAERVRYARAGFKYQVFHDNPIRIIADQPLDLGESTLASFLNCEDGDRFTLTELHLSGWETVVYHASTNPPEPPENYINPKKLQPYNSKKEYLRVTFGKTYAACQLNNEGDGGLFLKSHDNLVEAVNEMENSNIQNVFLVSAFNDMFNKRVATLKDLESSLSERGMI